MLFHKYYLKIHNLILTKILLILYKFQFNFKLSLFILINSNFLKLNLYFKIYKIHIFISNFIFKVINHLIVIFQFFNYHFLYLNYLLFIVKVLILFLFFIFSVFILILTKYLHFHAFINLFTQQPLSNFSLFLNASELKNAEIFAKFFLILLFIFNYFL